MQPRSGREELLAHVAGSSFVGSDASAQAASR